jgi:phosphopantothenoylcysteine decarboxylase/phosphopantothenate--cysteine ligase
MFGNRIIERGGMNLLNKHILLGVTGGIAAYKSADLVRRLRDAGAEVRVVMTAAAQGLVTPLTFQALSGHKVSLDWEQADSAFAMDHIALARWADLILIAPATADFMAKLAHGFADDVLGTLCLAAKTPIVVAPAMNQQMWQNLATQANKKRLLELGMRLLGPAEGSQACGDYGLGRMLEPVDIVQCLPSYLQSQILQGTKVLLTAGPTQEAIDPVRYLSNYSSGKMGYALAQVAAMLGAEVTLISGPTNLACPYQVNRISVLTAQQMYETVLSTVEKTDITIFISAAAVADYRPAITASQKMKKISENVTLELEKTPDILKIVAQKKPEIFSIGFAAETENVLENARHKLQQKNIDMIIANQVGVGQTDGGFNSDKNAVTALWKGGEQAFPLCLKTELAGDLWELIVKRLEV